VVRIAEFGHHWGRFGWLACFFYAVAAALRLARFNARAASATSATSKACRARPRRRSWRRFRVVRQRLARARADRTDRGLRRDRDRRRADGQPLSYPSFKQFDLDRRIRFVYMLLVPLVL